MASTDPVLLIDDDPAVRAQVSGWLAAGGLPCHEVEHGEAAMATLEAVTPSVVLLDLVLPGMPGLELLRRLGLRLRWVPVVVLTAHREADVAVECLKAGAYDYLTKPLEETRLLTSVANALRHHQLASALASQALARHGPGPSGGEAYRALDRAADHDVSVLLHAAPGAGASAARAIHGASARAAGPFAALDCRAVLPEDHLAWLLGAAAGGVGPGLVAEAAGGTLLVDGIEALSPAAQQALAAALAAASEGRAAAQGRPGFRLVASTAADLPALVRQGAFRRDLYLRAAVLEVSIAPAGQPAAPGPAGDPLRLAELERRAILEALQRTGGNRAAASRDLGISRATLYRRLRDLGVE